MAQIRQLRALINVKWWRMWRNTDPDRLACAGDELVSCRAITCGKHEIKYLFTAKDMTLRRAGKWTERRCLMDEGLAWARYHDNNRQVQPHLHVSKVKKKQTVTSDLVSLERYHYRILAHVLSFVVVGFAIAIAFVLQNLLFTLQQSLYPANVTGNKSFFFFF